MKKYIKHVSASVFLLIIMSSWNGCDLFNSLPLNIPFSINVDMQSNGSTLSGSQQGCLSTNSDTYMQYSDRINSLHFVAAAFRTKSVNPSDLSGDIIVRLLNDSETELFADTLENVKPADYMSPNSPFEIQLSQNQIDFINTYLDEVLHQGVCFKAEVEVENLNGQPPYSLKGAIDMVIEADTRL